MRKAFIVAMVFGCLLPVAQGAEEEPRECTVTIAGGQKQAVHFGIDAERLWFFWPELREDLAEKGVGELKVDYVRVPINCA